MKTKKLEQGDFYIIGQMFYHKLRDEKYILAQVVASKVALIGLTSGNRFNDPIRVEDIWKVSYKEMMPIAVESFGEIELILPNLYAEESE